MFFHSNSSSKATWIPEDLREVMKSKASLNSDGDVIVTSMKYRNQDDNIIDAMKKLTTLLRDCCDAAEVPFSFLFLFFSGSFKFDFHSPYFPTFVGSNDKRGREDAQNQAE